MIPGNHGKKFTTDAKSPEEFEKIKETLLNLDGIKNVVFEKESSSTVFVIQTDRVFEVKEIEAR